MTDILSPYEQADQVSQEHDDTQFQKMSEMWRQRREGLDMDTEMQKVEDERAQNILRARQLWHRLAPMALLETDKAKDLDDVTVTNEELNQLKKAWNITDDELNTDYEAQFRTLWSDCLQLIQGEWNQPQADALGRELRQQPVMKYLFDSKFPTYFQNTKLRDQEYLRTIPQYLSLAGIVYSQEKKEEVEQKFLDAFFAEMLNWDTILIALNKLDLSKPEQKSFVLTVVTQYLFRYSSAEQSEYMTIGLRKLYRGKELVNAQDVDEIIARTGIDKAEITQQLTQLFIDELKAIFNTQLDDDAKIKKLSSNLMRYLSFDLPREPESAYSQAIKEIVEQYKKEGKSFPWEKLLPQTMSEEAHPGPMISAAVTTTSNMEEAAISFENIAQSMEQGVNQQSDFEIVADRSEDTESAEKAS